MPDPQVLQRPNMLAPKPPTSELEEDHLGRDHLQAPKTRAPKPPGTLSPPKKQAPLTPPRQKLVDGNQEVSEQVYGNEARMPTNAGAGVVTGKYGLSLSTVGGGFGLGSGIDSNGGAVGSSFASSGLGVIESSLGLYYSGKRKEESELYGDKGGKKLSEDEGKNSSLGLLQGGVGLAEAGMKTASIAKHGEQGVMTLSDVTGKTGGMVSSGLTVGTEALGIAGHAISAVQSGYELFCASSKLWPKIKDKIFSARGQEWRARIMQRQKVKAAMQSLKLAAAGIGIAAGILVLASNPVGWALGIGAAVVGAGFALGKIGNTVRETFKRRKARKELQRNGTLGLSQEELDKRQDKQPEPQEESENQKPVTDQEREKVKAMADTVAAMVSQNAKVANEMHLAIKNGEGDFYKEKLRLSRLKVNEVPSLSEMGTKAQEYSDACTLADLLKVDPKEAGSASGTELLESKISALNGA